MKSHNIWIYNQVSHDQSSFEAIINNESIRRSQVLIKKVVDNLFKKAISERVTAFGLKR